jgi:hypothetical protein
MTTLTSKVQDVTKRLQHLTVWRPNDRDPFFELDRWRLDAHTAIEQVYIKKRQQIEQLSEKHEREFMRQLTRQRLLLNNIRKRVLIEKDIRSQNETSILMELQKVENDINTKLGRGEISIEATSINFDDSVIVSLKTYLSATSSMYVKELSTRNQVQKPVRRSANEVTRAFEEWRQVKDEHLKTTNQELQTIKQKRDELDRERRTTRSKGSEEAYNKWRNRKEAQGGFIKNKVNNDDDNIQQETNLT